MKNVAIFIVRLYQLCLRPFVGNCCRFAPSCSEYAMEAFRKKGFCLGAWLTIKRLARCHPWNPGGYDPVDR